MRIKLVSLALLFSLALSFERIACAEVSCERSQESAVAVSFKSEIGGSETYRIFASPGGDLFCAQLIDHSGKDSGWRQRAIKPGETADLVSRLLAGFWKAEKRARKTREWVHTDGTVFASDIRTKGFSLHVVTTEGIGCTKEMSLGCVLESLRALAGS